MAQAYMVQIDLAKLRFNLSKAHSRIFTEQDVRDWLGRIGMVETHTGWIAQEATLEQLNVSTIVRCRRIA